MDVKYLAEKYEIPDDMWYIGDDVISAHIIIDKAQYIFFWKDKVMYQSGGVLLGIKEEKQVKKLLYSSKQYVKHIRKIKLNELDRKQIIRKQKIDKLNDE